VEIRKYQQRFCNQGLDPSAGDKQQHPVAERFDRGRRNLEPERSGGFTCQDLGVVSTSWQIADAGDFNGSGRDGILWRNTNGDVALWNANTSGGFAYQDLGVVAASWQIFKHS
jgi:hypothetical protein